jgi:hypothetical protein
MNPKHFFVAILAALTGFLSVQSIAAEEQRRTLTLRMQIDGTAGCL